MEGEFFTSIGEGGTIALLLAMRSHDGAMMLKDLLHVMSNQRTLRLRLNRMEEDGLVDIRVISEGHKHVDVRLTSLGNDVALMFSVLDVLVCPEKNIRDKSIDMRYADPILRMLRGRDFVVQKEFLERMPSYDPVVRVLDMMLNEDLIYRTVNRKGCVEIRYSLTPLGTHVADVYQNVYEKIVS